MQILEIVLYGKDGRKRVLPFEVGKVNIITGKSATGKSALIHIIDYCLGRGSCPIPEGVIRERVSWYGLRLQFAETQIFIARENPQPDQLSTNKAYINQGKIVESPPAVDLIVNTTSDALVELLSQRIGISPNRNIPAINETRLPLAANIRHALFYCFQPQGVIADKDTLFFRQSEDFMTQTIKDTLPYFLGAIQENRLALEQELKQARRELKLIEKQLQQVEAIRGEGAARALSLLAEARQVGIIDDGPAPNELELLIPLLVNTQSWTEDDISFSGTDKLVQLQQEFHEIKDSLREMGEHIQIVKSFAKETEGFMAESAEQELRLESIGLYESLKQNNAACPLCSHELVSPVPHVTEIRESLESLRVTLDLADRERPLLRDYIDKIEGERAIIRLQLTQKQEEINGVYTQIEAAKSVRDANVQRGKVVGRISLWLESTSNSQDTSDLEEKSRRQAEVVSRLESQLDNEDKQGRIISILSKLSVQMTEWSTRLALEHSGNPVRLDLSRITVVVDRDRPIPLSNIGSGKNWLGAHIVTHLSLHKHYRDNSRPVPAFLVLDQPTQVFYPSDYDEEQRKLLEGIPDEDREAVSALFDLIFDVTESITPKLQIIITDHADLPNERFQEAVVERWRGNAALIPTNWLNDLE